MFWSAYEGIQTYTCSYLFLTWHVHFLFMQICKHATRAYHHAAAVHRLAQASLPNCRRPARLHRVIICITAHGARYCSSSWMPNDLLFMAVGGFAPVWVRDQNLVPPKPPFRNYQRRLSPVSPPWLERQVGQDVEFCPKCAEHPGD